MDQNPPKESRPPINLRIKFRSESVEQFIERYAVDVSRGGIFIRTREPLAVGTQLKLDFQFQNGTALMAGDGTVVWIREFDANRTSVPPGMGVRFDKLTPESQAVLEQLLLEKAKRERSGIPGSTGQSAGGIAVRRPSSTFSVLEGQAAGSASGPVSPSGASSGPLGPLATVTAQAASSLQAGSPAAPATATAAPSGEPTQKADAPAYRPLGKARNPFSVNAPEAASTADETAVATTVAKTPVAADADESAAPFDDINDEPTQIAGRLPSFLLSDDDATVANAQAPGRAEAGSDRGEGGNAASSIGKAALRKSPKEASAETGAAGTTAARTALPGMGRDLAGSTRKQPAEGNLAAGDKDATTAPAPEANVKAAAAGGGNAKDDQPDADSTVAAPTTAASTAKSSTSGQRPSNPRRSGAAIVAGTVVVLGAASIFLFRFFSSQSTQTGPSLGANVGTAVSAGSDPTVAPGSAPPTLPAAGSAAPPEPQAGTPSAPSGTAPSAAANAPSAPTGAAQPPPQVPPPAPAGNPPAGYPSEGAPAANRAVVEAPESGAHKAQKRRPARATRDSEAAGAAPTDGKNVDKAGDKRGDTVPAAVPSTAAAVAATEPATAGPAAPPAPAAASGNAKPDEHASAVGDSEGPSHQIRITSKPEGADVTLDGQTVGKTPFVVGMADVNAPHFIAVHKNGFEPFEQMISATSPWSKPKGTKGKPVMQVLKVTAKLKPIAGAEVRPAAEAEPAGGGASDVTKAQPAKAPAPAKPASANSPSAPAEERPAAEGKP